MHIWLRTHIWIGSRKCDANKKPMENLLCNMASSSKYSSYNCLTSWDSYDKIPRYIYFLHLFYTNIFSSFDIISSWLSSLLSSSSSSTSLMLMLLIDLSHSRSIHFSVWLNAICKRNGWIKFYDEQSVKSNKQSCRVTFSYRAKVIYCHWAR